MSMGIMMLMLSWCCFWGVFGGNVDMDWFGLVDMRWVGSWKVLKFYWIIVYLVIINVRVYGKSLLFLVEV